MNAIKYSPINNLRADSAQNRQGAVKSSFAILNRDAVSFSGMGQSTGQQTSLREPLDAKSIEKEVASILNFYEMRTSGDTAKDLAKANSEGIRKDVLTGIYNRGALMCILRDLLKKSYFSNEPFSMMMGDIDDFKAVNELLGYRTGDEFIKEIGTQLRKAAYNGGGLTFRLGGEELVSICPHSSKERTAWYAEQARSALSNSDVMNDKIDEFVTNGRAKIAELQKKQKDYVAIERTDSNLKHLEELLSKQAKLKPHEKKLDTDFLKEEKSRLEKLFDTKLRGLIKKALKDLTVKSGYRVMLEECLGELDAGKDARIVFKNQKLKEFFESKYNHKVRIAQIQKWVDSVIENQGFTITIGIEHFEGKELETQKPEDILEATEKLLKEGKQAGKNRVCYQYDN